MSLTSLLTEIQERGLRLECQAGRLHYFAPSGSVSPALRKRLIARRSELIEMLRCPGSSRQVPDPATPLSDWSPEMVEAYEERAAIMEFDGGLLRHVAERHAIEAVRGGPAPVASAVESLTTTGHGHA